MNKHINKCEKAFKVGDVVELRGADYYGDVQFIGEIGHIRAWENGANYMVDVGDRLSTFSATNMAPGVPTHALYK